MKKYGKVELKGHREEWSPVPLPEQVVMVTTADAAGEPHVATKTRLTVLSYGPPTVVVFMCRTEYPTASNIDAVGEFVLNIPGDDLVATSWVVGIEPSNRGIQLFAENGLSPIPSLQVQVPRIAECRAHLECRVVDTKFFGNETAVFGEVVSVSVNRDIAEKMDPAKKYAGLAPIFYLEAGWTASLGPARLAESPVPGPKHDVTILAVRDLARSIGFYTKAFDWSIRTQSKSYAELELPGGLALALCTVEGFEKTVGRPPSLPENGISSVQVYLRSDDLPRSIARLHAAGARALSKASDRDWGEEAAYFADPDGHVLVVSRPSRK